MLVFHGGGRAQYFEGSYSEYINFLRELGPTAAAAQGFYTLPGA
jgi:hypothetical protein